MFLNVMHLVQACGNEVAALHHEKGQQEERVLSLEKSTSHANVLLRKKRSYKGVDNVKAEDDEEKVKKTEDDGEEIEKTEDVGEETHKTVGGEVAKKRHEFAQNEKENIDIFIAEDDCGDDVIVGIQQKRGLGNSATLGLVTKRQRSMARKTPWQGWEIPIFWRTQLVTLEASSL
ncbi:unnamed protein product [Prunus armeniaca]|uniref:Uncharacterized protein n=1 Tax=Prunus armeniaca TaxID=36596 RepID=A0A6J5X3J4_PRUAR|nr:unnamed protein product [Prunus armeniaca]